MSSLATLHTTKMFSTDWRGEETDTQRHREHDPRLIWRVSILPRELTGTRIGARMIRAGPGRVEPEADDLQQDKDKNDRDDRACVQLRSTPAALAGTCSYGQYPAEWRCKRHDRDHAFVVTPPPMRRHKRTERQFAMNENLDEEGVDNCRADVFGRGGDTIDDRSRGRELSGVPARRRRCPCLSRPTPREPRFFEIVPLRNDIRRDHKRRCNEGARHESSNQRPPMTCW